MGQTSQHSYSGDVDAVCNVCSYTRTIVVTEPTEETEETVALMEKTEPTVEATVTETVKATELSNGDDEIPFGEDTPKKPDSGFNGILVVILIIVMVGSLATLIALLIYKETHWIK